MRGWGREGWKKSKALRTTERHVYSTHHVTSGAVQRVGGWKGVERRGPLPLCKLFPRSMGRLRPSIANVSRSVDCRTAIKYLVVSWQWRLSILTLSNESECDIENLCNHKKRVDCHLVIVLSITAHTRLVQKEEDFSWKKEKSRLRTYFVDFPHLVTDVISERGLFLSDAFCNKRLVWSFMRIILGEESLNVENFVLGLKVEFLIGYLAAHWEKIMLNTRNNYDKWLKEIFTPALNQV